MFAGIISGCLCDDDRGISIQSPCGSLHPLSGFLVGRGHDLCPVRVPYLRLEISSNGDLLAKLSDDCLCVVCVLNLCSELVFFKFILY